MPQEAAFSIYVIFNCTYLITASRQVFLKISLPFYYACEHSWWISRYQKIHLARVELCLTESWPSPRKEKACPTVATGGITSGKFKRLLELYQLCRKDMYIVIFYQNPLHVCAYVSTYLNLNSECYVSIHSSLDTPLFSPAQQPSKTWKDRNSALYLGSSLSLLNTLECECPWGTRDGLSCFWPCQCQHFDHPNRLEIKPGGGGTPL